MFAKTYSNNVNVNIVAVSYTHLDVYKRQVVSGGTHHRTTVRLNSKGIPVASILVYKIVGHQPRQTGYMAPPHGNEKKTTGHQVSQALLVAPRQKIITVNTKQAIGVQHRLQVCVDIRLTALGNCI